MINRIALVSKLVSERVIGREKADALRLLKAVSMRHRKAPRTTRIESENRS